jgi:hypothetical protein
VLSGSWQIGKKDVQTERVNNSTYKICNIFHTEALELQQDALQFAVWVGDSGRVVTKISDHVHQQRWQLVHSPMELSDGLPAEVCGKSRVDVPETGCLCTASTHVGF